VINIDEPSIEPVSQMALPLSQRPKTGLQSELPSSPISSGDLIAQLRDRDARLEDLARTVLHLQHNREGLQREVQTLQLALEKLLQQIYGRSGKRFLEDPTQQKLDFGNVPQAEEAFRDAVAEAQKMVHEIEARRKAKQPPTPKGRVRKFPEHLPRVEKIIDVPGAQTTCA
jgi:hypothetical protein